MHAGRGRRQGWQAAILIALGVLISACVPQGAGAPDATTVQNELGLRPKPRPVRPGEPVAVALPDVPKAAMADAADPDAAPPPEPGQAATVPAEVAEDTAQDAEADAAAAAAALAVPEADAEQPKSEAQLKCERRRGIWTAVAGTSARTCVTRTRDAGKSCDKQSDCDSECLARSRTCAPLKPLIGCNDVLQENGVETQLCVQ
jgi:type IV secretory pathway VirB10-like protein